jgi:hypothetical protein
MPLDTTVKLGPEVRLYLSSSSQSLLSIDLQGNATETGAITWEEVGFVRFPLSWSEPIEIIDIYKRFDIDHTKRGRAQRQTGSFVAAFQNTQLAVRGYHHKNCMMKIEWHVEDAAAVDEYEYLKGVRFTNLTRDNPDQEATQRVEFVFATYGRRNGP